MKNDFITKKFAFTLAEVLITLGIVGIVAAMTIPTLMQKQFEKQAVSKLRETQSILAQSIRMAEEENGDVSGWGVDVQSSASAIKIAENIKPYLKLAHDCGISDENHICVTSQGYKLLNGSEQGRFGFYGERTECYKILLANGSAIWWRGGMDGGQRNITFWIDINGKSLPNTYGKDLFVFSYENNSIKPLGAENSDSPWKTSCTKISTGYGCAYYVLQNQNMNYLH